MSVSSHVGSNKAVIHCRAVIQFVLQQPFQRQHNLTAHTQFLFAHTSLPHFTHALMQKVATFFAYF
jgi:hypothetical protein